MSQLVVSGFGAFLSKKSERVLVRQGDKVVFEFPLFRLSEIVISSRGITLSSDIIMACCERGIRLSFLTGGGKPYAMITSPMLTAVVAARRAQMEALSDRRGFEFARAIVTGKLRNQENLLRYFLKHLKNADPDRAGKITQIATSIRELRAGVEELEADSIEQARADLMGREGTGARVYWDGVAELIREKVTFLGREHRGATDGVNSLLNYGYGILYSQVWGAALNAGLEPFAGFLHVDRPGKPSLVLDLVEEFRQPIVDRVVVAYVDLGVEIGMASGMLDERTRRGFAEKVIERLETVEQFRGKKHQMRSIIQMQARLLAKFLRGEAEYAPYVMRW
ncbi:MAG: CRISPR-associated endonuclease Cas1 [Deltaproteobacteria bacterium]|nr:CRISPR-associated endonuclease Cas1 [Deltaproteobacteria bacterium]